MLSRGRQGGATLVETLVGLTVGLLVIVGAIALFLGTSRAGRQSIQTQRYQQDLRAVMDILVADLRRAGYSGASATGANLFTAAATDLRIVGPARDCILYAYDTTWRASGASAGLVDAGLDFAGFRLNNGVVEALRSTSLSSTAQASCEGLGWEALSDANAVRVTRLEFALGGSSCIAADPLTYDPGQAATFVTWTTTSPTTTPACTASAPGAPSPYPPATWAFVETRQVTVRLQGRTAGASPIERQPLVETVALRNHRVSLP